MAVREWWVYVAQSLNTRIGKRGTKLPGFFYVGASTDPPRRLRQHNGEIRGGGRYTSKHRNWCLRAIFGPYTNQSEALKAERALKKGLRGVRRTQWTPEDSPWCWGLGTADPRVKLANDALDATLRARADAGLPPVSSSTSPSGGRPRRSRRSGRKGRRAAK